MALDDDRRGLLLAAKFKALVRAATGTEPVTASFPGGATARVGDQGWFHADRDPARGLGPALAWARQQSVEDLHVVVEEAAGEVARRAARFRRRPTVWRVEGDHLVEVEPAPLRAPVEPPVGIETLEALLHAADVDVVVEHGRVTGEIAGLEIARVVVEAGEPRLEVGVGRHDREAFALVHGDLPAAEALRSVASTVRTHRRPGAPDHPLNRLAADRWLRDRILADASAFALTALEPRSLTVPRASVKDRLPAAAVGEHPAHGRVVVVCSVGVDLDLVPTAADVRLAAEAEGPVGGLWLVVPERDDLPVTRALAAELIDPAVVVPIRGDWRQATAIAPVAPA